MAIYHVALWRSWSHDSWAGYPWLPAVTDDVEADSPLLAVLMLMGRAHLRFVRHAAAQADETHVLTRFERLKLYADPITAPAADESEVDV